MARAWRAATGVGARNHDGAVSWSYRPPSVIAQPGAASWASACEHFEFVRTAGEGAARSVLAFVA